MADPISIALLVSSGIVVATVAAPKIAEYCRRAWNWLRYHCDVVSMTMSPRFYRSIIEKVGARYARDTKTQSCSYVELVNSEDPSATGPTLLRVPCFNTTYYMDGVGVEIVTNGLEPAGVRLWYRATEVGKHARNAFLKPKRQ